MEGEEDNKKQEEKSSVGSPLSGQEVEAETQEWTSIDDQDLPIMHWEALNLRIAELEKQEEERRKKAKDKSLGGWIDFKPQGPQRKQWIDTEDFGECRIPVVTSRFNTPKNLQLCFINNSESEDEDDEGASSKGSSSDAEGRGNHSSGLKQEVRVALSQLRDKLWAEEKEKERLASTSTAVNKKKQLDQSELQSCTLEQLDSLRASLNKDIHDLSSELVRHLLIRDHLRTKQDAMLLDVQDMTSL